MVPIFEINSDSIVEVPTTDFGTVKVREREDLQRLLRDHIDVVAPDTLIISEEFSDWEDSRRRIDLLGLDKSANLVVFELKRTEDGGHMELQAIRYAAMVANLTFDQVVEIFERFLARQQSEDDARESILEFLDWDEPDEDSFCQDVRIVLISADFSKEITSAVLWLNQRDLDIRCIRMRPYNLDGRVLAEIEQILPLPEAEEFQVKVREKAIKERSGRKKADALKELRREFWEGLLGLCNQKTDSFSKCSPWGAHYQNSAPILRKMHFSFSIQESTSWIGFYMESQKDENKRVFDALFAHKDEIERTSGLKGLRWERNPNKKHSKIVRRYDPRGIGIPKDDWSKLQEEMVNDVIRLENALRPFLLDYAKRI